MGNELEDIIRAVHEDLKKDLDKLEKRSEDLRLVAEEVIELGASVAMAKIRGEDIQLSAMALKSAVLSLKAAAQVEIAVQIRRSLLNAFHRTIRDGLSIILHA